MNAKHETEKIAGVVKAYEVGKSGSLTVVILKELRDKYNINKGTKFLVKDDQQGRIIFELLKSEENKI